MGLTRKGFEAWLAAKADDEVVGQRSKEHACPLARYIQEQGYPHAEVNGYIYYRERPSSYTRPVPLRLWAQRFVRAVDRAFVPPARNTPRENVTAAEARTILRSL